MRQPRFLNVNAAALWLLQDRMSKLISGFR